MLDDIQKIIDNCDQTISELEQKYTEFIIFGGGNFSTLDNLFLQQINSVRIEKSMYEKIISQKELVGSDLITKSYSNIH